MRSDSTIILAASVGAAPAWQAIVALVVSVFTVLFGVLLITHRQIEAATKAQDKRLEDLFGRAELRSTGIENLQKETAARLTESSGRVEDSAKQLGSRVDQLTSRLDAVISQQGTAARELNLVGTKLRDVLDERLGSISSAIGVLGQRVSDVERDLRERRDPFG